MVLSMTNPGDWVLDPYVGVGTAAAAAVRHRRRGLGADLVPRYIDIARERVLAASRGELRVRPMDRPVYQPSGRERIAKSPLQFAAWRRPAR